VTADPYFNHLSWSSISLHKRQVDPRNTFAESFDFGHKHSEVERPIL